MSVEIRTCRITHREGWERSDRIVLVSHTRKYHYNTQVEYYSCLWDTTQASSPTSSFQRTLWWGSRCVAETKPVFPFGAQRRNTETLSRLILILAPSVARNTYDVGGTAAVIPIFAFGARLAIVARNCYCLRTECPDRTHVALVIACGALRATVLPSAACNARTYVRSFGGSAVLSFQTCDTRIFGLFSILAPLAVFAIRRTRRRILPYVTCNTSHADLFRSGFADLARRRRSERSFTAGTRGAFRRPSCRK